MTCAWWGDLNCGKVRGPLQLGLARSVEPIVPVRLSITRMAATKAEAGKDNKTMGEKWIVPYGLYRAHGFISGRLANDQKKGTGFSEEDLRLFWEALSICSTTTGRRRAGRWRRAG